MLDSCRIRELWAETVDVTVEGEDKAAEGWAWWLRLVPYRVVWMLCPCSFMLRRVELLAQDLSIERYSEGYSWKPT